jgi:hypothetical protein
VLAVPIVVEPPFPVVAGAVAAVAPLPPPPQAAMPRATSPAAAAATMKAMGLRRVMLTPLAG